MTPDVPAPAEAAPDVPPDAPAEAGEAPRLRDCPNWLYLLREYEALYRHGSAGGSQAIRTHRKKVRDTLSAVIAANPPVLARAPAVKPVTEHFARALDLGERGAMQGMARALREIRGRLTWEYGYERVPRALARKYAYCEVLGPRGPVLAETLVLGFVLFAPTTTYPQHSHRDIEESYVSVAGAWSENDAAVYAPGSLILNRPEHEHRITTGDLDPCLLAYAWTGQRERLAAPGMVLTPSRRARAARAG
ncbi:dimethylsulfonioproprionate lyase family protein [Oceanicella sp. SM1341]|uniref:dimethylsulfonioproprionate lyase family protein n=1 Tax=Oceanicella sp. SM1341 TaxID=1548889 RepID=UPI000E4DC5C6|nr:dimethylsulfonioproprionate lyase family protein [Oceanicella sp. SM1341]